VPSAKDFETSVTPTWCPGCGNFGMWQALRGAYEELGWDLSGFAVVWGIGCHGNGADFTRCQGFHALHGRALPVATGLVLTRPDLKVVVEMGDGDCYGIGGNHLLHSCRRNIAMTAIVHDNQVYGLTTGQASPTTEHLVRTPSTPTGVLEQPVNAVGLAVAEGATFVARGFAGDVPHLQALLVAALSHKGFALVDVLQPCVTWNKLNTFGWFRERVYKLDESGHDASDRAKALELSLTAFHEMTCTPEECRVPIGVFYRVEGVETYQDGLTHVDRPSWRYAIGPRDVAATMSTLT